MAKLKGSKIPISFQEITNVNKEYNPLVLEIELPPTTVWVFEGGGVKGVAFAGAIESMQDELANVKSVAGTSAGGLMAALVALGFKPDQIKDIMFSTNFSDLMNDRNNHFWDPLHVLEKIQGIHNLLFTPGHGYASGDSALQFFEQLIAQALGNPSATFRDLHNALNLDPKFKDLKLTGTNLTRQTLQIFDFENTPDMRIADAMRITMSFPGAFAAFPLEVDGHIEYFIDGGVANNFPANIYNRRKYIAEGYDFNERGINPCVKGFLVDNEKEMRMKLWNQIKKEDYEKNDNIFSYLLSVISAFQINLNVPPFAMQIVQIYDDGISTLDSSISDEKKQRLYRNGLDAAIQYKKNYRDGAYYNHQIFNNLQEKYEHITYDDAEEIMLFLEDAYLQLLENKDRSKSEKINERLEQIRNEMLAIRNVFGIPILSPALYHFKTKTLELNMPSFEDISTLDWNSIVLVVDKPDLEKLMSNLDTYSINELVSDMLEKIEDNLSLLIDLKNKFSNILQINNKHIKYIENNQYCIQSLSRSIKSLQHIKTEEQHIQLKESLKLILSRKGLNSETKKEYIEIFDKASQIWLNQHISEKEKKVVIGEVLKQLDMKHLHNEKIKQEFVAQNFSVQKSLDEINQQININQQAYNLYKFAPASVSLLKEIAETHGLMSNFINKKISKLTKVVTWMVDHLKVSDKFLPINIVCYRKAKELEKQTSNMINSLSTNQSPSNLIEQKSELNKQIDRAIVSLSQSKLSFWGSTRRELVDKLKEQKDRLNNELKTQQNLQKK